MLRLRWTVALLPLFLSGCGVIVFEEPLQPRSVKAPAPAPSRPFRAEVRKRPPIPRHLAHAPAPSQPPAVERARLPRENPPAALAVIRRAVKGGAEEGAFAGDYPLVINGAIDVADALRGRGDLPGAGKIYRLVVEAYPRTPALIVQVKRSREQLLGDIGFCAERMMENGIAEYRRGRMEEALALWQNILSFDPKNTGARRAVDTSRRQLDALRALD